MSKKITFILGSMAGGGAERVTANLVEYYSKRKYNIQIIMLLNNRVDYKLPNEVELTYISVENSSQYNKPVQWLRGLRKELKESSPDVIVSFFAKINLLVLLASIGLKIPIFISERNDPEKDGRSRFIKLLTFLMYPLSKGIIFQTKHAQACFPKKIQKKSTIIPNPVNVNYDTTKKKRLTKTIVSVGKLMEQKNHKLLINSFALAVDNLPGYKLCIYGEGELKGQLRELILEKGLENRVFLMGRTSDVFDIVYNADVFILSSDYEGLSNALLEAMILETPVISTNCAGSNELIKNEKNGRLVPINDKSSMRDAILETIKNYDYAIDMAHKAKKEVEKFTLDVVCNKWDVFIKANSR